MASSLDLRIGQAPLAPLQRRMVERLREDFGQFVDGTRLADAVYAFDPNGGPDWTRHALAKIATRANRNLAGTGLRIESSLSGGRRLIWSDLDHIAEKEMEE